MSSIDNKRIAKNTLLLYIRMFLIMGVSLYTSRVILKALGVEDYGLYNLIAGFITLFTVISNALVNAFQRYFNFAIGIKDNKRFSDVFIMSINILILLSLLIIILSETLGVWFINNHLNIPDDRVYAANWVFQFAVLTFIVSILRTPYNAAIVAYEKMSFYAYVSILDVVFKLLIAYLLVFYNSDRLILYSILLLITTIIITYAYKIYANRKLNACKYSFFWDTGLFREIFSFSSWSLIGQTGYLIRGQGDSFLVNRFFSVTVNAAMGINNQIMGAISAFVTNFQIAFNPQLTKSYASNEIKEHISLLYRSSKISYFLVLILSLPIIFNIKLILEIWLVTVPKYTEFFALFGVVTQLFLALSAPLSTSILATGKIKTYQISLFLINIIGIIISLLFLMLGFEPYIIAVVNLFVQLFIFMSRLFYVVRLINFQILLYLKNVIFPLFLVTLLSLFLPYLTRNISLSLLDFIYVFSLNVVATSLIVFLIGFSKVERKFILKNIYNQFAIIKNK